VIVVDVVVQEETIGHRVLMLPLPMVTDKLLAIQVIQIYVLDAQ
jgi:hypothetical protein